MIVSGKLAFFDFCSYLDIFIVCFSYAPPLLGFQAEFSHNFT